VNPGKGWFRWVLFGLVIAYVALPIVAATLYSLSTSWTGNDGRVLPDGYTLHWWAGLVTDDRLIAAIGRSLLVALLAVLIVAALVLPPLYWSYVRNPRLRTVMSTVALIPFALPFVVMAFGIKDVTSHLPLVGQYSATWQLVVVGHVALCFPFFLWPVDAAMAAAGIPRLHEAAQTSGANSLTTLLRVVIPNIRTGILTGSILVFAISFGEYSIARVITGTSFETVPVWQVQLTPINGGGNPNGVAVMSVLTFVLFFAVSLVAALSRGGAESGGSLQALPGAATTRKGRP
jgi:putative spermidine/putrescine transport system permease protein